MLILKEKKIRKTSQISSIKHKTLTKINVN